MISKFVTVYPGHIDMPDLGQDATPANDREFSNDRLASVFEKLEAVAKQMDRFGWDTLWLAEHFVSLVAEREGAPVGFVVVRIERDKLAELVAIAVVENERGHGVGRALLKAAEIRARAGGGTGVVLHTAEANLAAFELFVKNGFRVRRRIRRYYVGVFGACEMVKSWSARSRARE